MINRVGYAYPRSKEVTILLYRRLLPFLLVIPVFLITQTGHDSTPAPPPEGGARVEVFYGQPLVRTSEKMLQALGAEMFPEDYVTFFPDPSLGLGSKITVIRATPVWVNDGGNQRLVRTHTKTVGELFDEQGIILGNQDSVEPSLEIPLLWEGTVAITRVEETEISVRQSIAFKTVTNNDAELFVGTTRVEQEGKNGTKEIIYKVKRVNGQEVSRALLSEQIVTEPVERIVLSGTKEPPVTERGLATWYRWKPGYFAAHKTLPFGTRVLVKSVANPERSVIVTINDRGPWAPDRVVDLQAEAFLRLAPLGAGIIQVTLSVLP
jgi:hypothetical protein